ncbi:MAG: hypothetical protein HY537_08960 [Deltaproteobacteria bacterium]|nr:hypothetical protein [Deltaproteobacteria bacterium]
MKRATSVKPSPSVTLIALFVALAIGGCTNRKVSSLNPVGDPTPQPVPTPTVINCSVTVNPQNVQVTVDDQGNMVDPKSITFAVISNVAIQVMSSNADPNALTLNTALPTQAALQNSIVADVKSTTGGSVEFLVQANNGYSTGSCAGNYQVTPITERPSPQNLLFNVTGDFTGDNVPDSAGWDMTTGYWWINRTKKFGSWDRLSQWTNVMASDLNSDGRADIIGRDALTGNWWVQLSSGTAFINQYLLNWNINAGLVPPSTTGGAWILQATDNNGVRWESSITRTNTAQNPIPVVASTPTSFVANLSLTTLDPLPRPYNTSTTLSWQAQNASNCVLRYGSNTIQLTGNSGTVQSDILTATTTFTLICSSPALAQMIRVIPVGEAPNPDITLNTDARIVRKNSRAEDGTVRVNWSSSNTTSCNLFQNGALVSSGVSGSYRESDISRPVTFRLACWSARGPIEAAKSVDVSTVLQATPQALDFGTVNIKERSAAQYIVIKNEDYTAATHIMVAISTQFVPAGGNCPHSPFRLGAGDQCRIGLAFRPTGEGRKNGTVQILYNDGISEISAPAIRLTGKGNKPKKGK